MLLFSLGNLVQGPGWIFLASAVLVRGNLTQRMLSKLHAHPIRNVIVLRTVFQTLAARNYTLAMPGIGIKEYMLATMLGLPLPITVYCLFFNYIVKIARIG